MTTTHHLGQCTPALYTLMANRLVLAIAHRFSTLRQMDRILVLDRGQLIAEGTHEDLLESNALYARLWQAQTFF